MLLEISECCSPTTVIATNTLRLDVSAVADLVTHKEVCHQRVCVCVCVIVIVPSSLSNYLYIIIGLSQWPRGVADVDGRVLGGRHRRQAASVNRRRAQTVFECRRRERAQHRAWLTAAAKPQSSIDGRSGRRASRRPKL